MKILLISQYFSPEHFRINDIAIELSTRGHKVIVWTGIPNYPKGEYYNGYGLFKRRNDTIDSIDIHRLFLLPRKKGLLMLALNYASFTISGVFKAWFTRMQPDIVFTYSLSPVTQGIIGNIISRRKHVPHLNYILDIWPNSFEAITNRNHGFIHSIICRLSKSIYLRNTHIAITSPGFESDLVKMGVPSSKISYIPQYYEPLSSIEFTNSNVSVSKEYDFIYTGNIGKSQRLDIVIEAFDQLTNNSSHTIKMLLLGDGSEKNILKVLVDKLGLTEQVIFIDTVPFEKLGSYIVKSRFAILPLYDSPIAHTLPAKLQTYLSFGLPILALNSKSAGQIVVNAKAGLQSEFNINAVSRSMFEALQITADEYDAMSKNGKIYADTQFSKEKVMAQLENQLMHLKEINNV